MAGVVHMPQQINTLGQPGYPYEKMVNEVEDISVADAVRHYGLTFGKQSHDEFISFRNNVFPWGEAGAQNEDEAEAPQSDIKSAFERELQANEAGSEVTESGEEVLCKRCHLPVGDVRYTAEGEEQCNANALHGECMAHVLLEKMAAEEAETAQADKKDQEECRQEYGIGWKTSDIPRNEVAAGKLAVCDVSQGMVCLVMNQETNSVSLASTLEPAAAVNLEYLSTTLQVRRTEGHEPVFSLDPVSAEDTHDKHAMQEKVFVPEWLAETKVGDVLFQADYHLKELSMGQHTQPVIGMKSCFDISESDATDIDDWSAREWFLVRQAEMKITENNALIPCVKMAVEAREQVVQGDSLLDKPVTRPDHPMVRYAEAFTRNFDLIAERKSVVFHLRELAKTSILAKYLLDAGVQMEESWFKLYDVKESPSSLLVPQTWNRKLVANLEMGEKSIESGKDGKGSKTHGVYGGVNFGLDKFNLTSSTKARGSPLSLKGPAGLAKRAPSTLIPLPPTDTGAGATTGKVPPSTLATLKPAGGSLAPSSVGRASALLPAAKSTPSFIGSVRQLAAAGGLLPRVHLTSGAPSALATYGRQFTPPGMSSVTAPKMPHFAPPNASISAIGAPKLTGSILNAASLAAPRLASQLAPPTISLSAAQAMGAMVPPSPNLQGVDLRLDNFDLSSATRVSMQTDGNAARDVRALDKCMSLGKAFWSCLDDDSQKTFAGEDHTLLCKVFNPALSDRRAEEDLFCPPDTSSAYISKLRDLVRAEESLSEQRKELFFDKSFSMSEPGSTFPASWTSTLSVSRGSSRVCNVDALPCDALVARPEYKTNASGLVGSTLKAAVPMFEKATEDGMSFRIYRVGSLEIRTTQAAGETEVVGAVFSICSSAVAPDEQGADAISGDERIVHATEFVERTFGASDHYRYYLVLKTEQGHSIVTERLARGSVAWKENPSDLDSRNSLAKVTKSAACQSGVFVKDLKAYQSTIAKGAERSGNACASVCKRYADSAYSRVVGSESKQTFASTPWWMDIAQEKKQEKKDFVSLPNSMLKRA